MRDLTPRKEELESIEIASLDEIQDLQLSRLNWSVSHAYDNIEFYKSKYDHVGDSIIYGDTDSVYFSAFPILKKEIEAGQIPWTKESVIKLYDQVCGEANKTFLLILFTENVSFFFQKLSKSLTCIMPTILSSCSL